VYDTQRSWRMGRNHLISVVMDPNVAAGCDRVEGVVYQTEGEVRQIHTGKKLGTSTSETRGSRRDLHWNV